MAELIEAGAGIELREKKGPPLFGVGGYWGNIGVT